MARQWKYRTSSAFPMALGVFCMQCDRSVEVAKIFDKKIQPPNSVDKKKK
jgi:hypothetical protein